MEKIWDVWCKEVQYSMIAELKHLSLRSLNVASLLVEYEDAL
jgi:hypothetical protein